MKLRLSLAALAISLLLFHTAKAQTDSANYDLGRILVKKDFTQSITVKRSDIERYQFNNITDALDVFFYGTFTNSPSVVYVIDGNVVNDVNAYSIQDIDEITLVQNALGQVNGAGPGQQLVLIKTRRSGEGKQGVTASDQTSLVNARNNNNYPNALKPNGLYEQGYAGAYRNYENADFGFSANYLRDVNPIDLESFYTAYDPFHYNRFRLNGYADAKLWKGTTLSFDVNYTPEVNNESYAGNESSAIEQVAFTGKVHESQHLFNTNVRLHSHITGGLTNTFSIGYNHYNDFENAESAQTFNESGGFENNAYTLQHWQQGSRSLLIKDNIAWHQQIGNWSIDPSVNFMYRHLNDSLNLTEMNFADSITNNANYSSKSAEAANYNLSLLTPSINIYYKNIFDLQGGFTDILNKENLGPNFPVNHVLPFVSASLNISEWAKLQTVKLQLFASFSRQNDFLNDPYVSLDAFTLQGFDNSTGTYSPVTYPIGFSGYNTDKAYNNYQAGLVLGLFKNLSLSYNFRENYNWTLIEYAVPEGPNGAEIEYFYQDAKAMTNSVALKYDLHSGNFNWMPALTATTSKLQLVGSLPISTANTYLATGHRWTGGFTNRFAYKDFFAGVDVLYQIGQRPYNLENWQPDFGGYIPPSNNNSFSLQNLYFGKKLKITGLKYAEVYIDTRNILQNKSSDITDERRFYGFGFKVNW